MEYVAGGALDALIHRFGKLSESVASSYTRQILMGLHYLHRCTICSAALLAQVWVRWVYFRLAGTTLTALQHHVLKACRAFTNQSPKHCSPPAMASFLTHHHRHHHAAMA